MGLETVPSEHKSTALLASDFTKWALPYVRLQLATCTTVLACLVRTADLVKLARIHVVRKTFCSYTGITSRISALYLETVDHVLHKRQGGHEGRDGPFATHGAAVVFADPLGDAAAAEDVPAVALDGLTQHRVADHADQLLIGLGVIVFKCQLWDGAVHG